VEDLQSASRYQETHRDHTLFHQSKGGYGKSSTCFHLSGCLAELGFEVLLVDADPLCGMLVSDCVQSRRRYQIMTFPVFVEASQGQFTAQLVGAPFVQVVGTTRDQALAALRAAIQERVRTGELTLVEVEPLAVSDLAGTYRDDPTLREICDEAYRLRDSEREP
jgi:hypothetical protein